MSMPPLASSGSFCNVSMETNGAAAALRTRKPVSVCSTKSSVDFMAASVVEGVGLLEDLPRVVEVGEGERVFVAAPREGACLGAIGFSLVLDQEEKGSHGLSVHVEFALSRPGDDRGAHSGFFSDFPDGGGLRSFAFLDVALGQDP